MSNGKDPNTNFGRDDGISLKDYVDRRFIDNQKAVDIAVDNLEIRLEGMNEFRQSLRDQASTFLTRAEHNALIAKINESVDDLKKSRDESFGKASMSSVWIAYLISIASLVFSIIKLFK